jgi:hypothetical protein
MLNRGLTEAQTDLGQAMPLDLERNRFSDIYLLDSRVLILDSSSASIFTISGCWSQALWLSAGSSDSFYS